MQMSNTSHISHNVTVDAYGPVTRVFVMNDNALNNNDSNVEVLDQFVYPDQGMTYRSLFRYETPLQRHYWL
jgi:hypothetical protein